MLNNERNFVRSDLKNRTSAFSTRLRVPESGVKESGVMDSKFAHQSVIGDHFCRIRGRNPYGLVGRQNIKVCWVQNQSTPSRRPHWFPEILKVVVALSIDIDKPGMRLCFEPDDPFGTVSADVHRYRYTVSYFAFA